MAMLIFEAKTVLFNDWDQVLASSIRWTGAFEIGSYPRDLTWPRNMA
jgi:hypothetical protein